LVKISKYYRQRLELITAAQVISFLCLPYL
jgi:hypothetical protein